MPDHLTFTNCSVRAWRKRRGFTLLEVLLAAATTALLLTALTAMFRTVMHARERSRLQTDATWRRHRCADTLYRDLLHMVPPDDRVTTGLTGTAVEEAGVHRDTVLFDSAVNRVHESVFGSDVIRISYALEMESRTADAGNLVRGVWRNPLALSEEEPEESILLTNVRSLTLEYYDGESWLPTWDTALQDGALPQAVRVILEQAEEEEHGEPLVTVVPVHVRKAEASAQGGQSNASR